MANTVEESSGPCGVVDAEDEGVEYQAKGITAFPIPPIKSAPRISRPLIRADAMSFEPASKNFGVGNNITPPK